MILPKNRIKRINSIKISKTSSIKKIQKNKNFKDVFQYFCDNTSIPGFNRIGDEKISFKERVLWMCFNLAVFIISVFILNHLWQEYLQHPTFITADTSDISIANVDFPGVSICNANKISKKKAHSLMEYLYIQYPSIKSLFKNKGDILEGIKQLAGLYDFSVFDKTQAATLYNFFETNVNFTNIADPTDLLVQLAPTCEEILLNCKWNGIEYDCLDLFRVRGTFDGFCCTFNYLRPVSKLKTYQKMNKGKVDRIPRMYGKGSGVNRGLQVVLANNLDDYFVTTTEIKGHVVSIFNPFDFPDKSSGSLTEIMANSGSEVFISLEVFSVQSQDNIRILPINKRECIFSDELNTYFGSYRNSDCLAACKIKAMKTLCDCIAFYQPLDGWLDICSLIDLPCLDKFKTKWTNYYPDNEYSSQLGFEHQVSIKCSECYAACEDEIYVVSVDISPIVVTPTNNTYLNVYFNSPFSDSFKRVLNQTWFELLSNFGGFISLFMGISFIGLAEIFILLYNVFIHTYHRVQSSIKNAIYI